MNTIPLTNELMARREQRMEMPQTVSPIKHIKRNRSSKRTGAVVRAYKRRCDTFSDAELVALCQARNPVAFDVLVRRHQRTISNIIGRVAPDWQDSDDIQQEVLLRLWNHIGSLRNPHALQAWIKRIALNLFYDELRKRPKHLVVSLDKPCADQDGEQFEVTREIKDSSAEPAELCELKELDQLIGSAIVTLPECYRRMIWLRDVQGLSYEEIVSITRCKIGTVKSRIARARAKVQALLLPYIKSA